MNGSIRWSCDVDIKYESPTRLRLSLPSSQSSNGPILYIYKPHLLTSSNSLCISFLYHQLSLVVVSHAYLLPSSLQISLPHLIFLTLCLILYFPLHHLIRFVAHLSLHSYVFYVDFYCVAAETLALMVNYYFEFINPRQFFRKPEFETWVISTLYLLAAKFIG